METTKEETPKEEVKTEAGEVTEVTTLAKEADKGAQIPSKEQMDAIAHRDFSSGLVTLEQLLKSSVKAGKISKRGLVRVLIAMLQFPEPDLKVDVKPGVETTAFGIGQRVQMSRFYLLMDQVQQEAQRRKAAAKAAKKAEKQTKKGKEKKDVGRKEK